MKSTFITERWPLVICTIIGKVNEEESFQNYLTSWSRLYLTASEGRGKFSLLFDIRELSGVDMKYLLGQAMFLKKTKKLTEKWLNKSAILVSKNSVRRILDFVFTIYRPVRPFKFFTDISKALEWISSDEDKQGDAIGRNGSISAVELENIFFNKKSLKEM